MEVISLNTSLNFTFISASNPCANNTCTHMCFKVNATSHECGCPTGKELSHDHESCIDVPRSYEIYFADSFAKTVNHLVKYQDQDGFSIRPLRFPSNERVGGPLALDFDPETSFVYWADHKTHKVYFHLPHVFFVFFLICSLGPVPVLNSIIVIFLHFKVRFFCGGTGFHSSRGQNRYFFMLSYCSKVTLITL